MVRARADECGDEETIEEFLAGAVGSKALEMSAWDYVSPVCRVSYSACGVWRKALQTLLSPGW
jgi:hypothetical protein